MQTEKRVKIYGNNGVEITVNPDGSINTNLTIPAINPWTIFRTTAAGGETSRVAKASAGTLRDVYISNAQAVDTFLQIFDAAALPANGTVPLIAALLCRAGQHMWYDFGETALPCGTGIVLAASTTQLTLTLATASCSFGGRFV